MFLQSTVVHKEMAPRKQLPQNNHKHGFPLKDFNENTDTSNNKSPPQAKIDRPRPKVNSVRFGDPYEHINPV